MSVKKNPDNNSVKEYKSCNNEDLNLLDNENIIEKVKRQGTITLDELILALSKNGIKGIDFQDMSFNLDKYCLNKTSKTSFNEMVEESFEQDCIQKINSPIVEDNAIDKDNQLLDVIIKSSFEEEDILKLLALVDVNKINEFIISTLSLNKYDLKTYVNLLMDLRK